jgi:hypothetical protein
MPADTTVPMIFFSGANAVVWRVKAVGGRSLEV